MRPDKAKPRSGSPPANPPLGGIFVPKPTFMSETMRIIVIER